MKLVAIWAILLINIISPLRLEAYNTFDNISPIPEWKAKIYSEFGLKQNTILMLHSINLVEYWKEDWMCLSPRHADAWPFQINQIHRSDHLRSEELIRRWDKEELFRFQLRWMIPRIIKFDNKYCNKLNDEKRVYMQSVLHNWNTRYNKYYKQFRYYYATKVLNIYKKLKVTSLLKPK